MLLARAAKDATGAKRAALTWNQGGKRLGDETSVSEQKGVMQWTGTNWVLDQNSKFKDPNSKS